MSQLVCPGAAPGRVAWAQRAVDRFAAARGRGPRGAAEGTAAAAAEAEQRVESLREGRRGLVKV